MHPLPLPLVPYPDTRSCTQRNRQAEGNTRRLVNKGYVIDEYTRAMQAETYEVRLPVGSELWQTNLSPLIEVDR